jgi:predicted DNA-binding transcriptional regulator YafY
MTKPVMDSRARQERIVARLRAGGPSSTEALAAELAVSPRTVFRDLAALRARGVDIRGDPGRGGGLSLDPRAAPAKVELSWEEAVGLVLTAALGASAGAPFGGPARRAAERIQGTLPAPEARALRRLLGRLVLGPPASAAVAASLRPVSDGVVKHLERAFAEDRALRFSYVDRQGERSRREVDPCGILAQPPAWYLLGVDERGQERMFRLDRLSACQVGARAVDRAEAERRAIVARLLGDVSPARAASDPAVGP